MPISKPISTVLDRPRHPLEEVADLLAVALLRLRTSQAATTKSADSGEKDAVALGFAGQQSVNANPYQGVRT